MEVGDHVGEARPHSCSGQGMAIHAMHRSKDRLARRQRQGWSRRVSKTVVALTRGWSECVDEGALYRRVDSGFGVGLPDDGGQPPRARSFPAYLLDTSVSFLPWDDCRAIPGAGDELGNQNRAAFAYSAGDRMVHAGDSSRRARLTQASATGSVANETPRLGSSTLRFFAAAHTSCHGFAAIKVNLAVSSSAAMRAAESGRPSAPWLSIANFVLG